MKPWREIAIPHTDVLKGTFQQAEFAADITAVRTHTAPAIYQDARTFFERTYITEGMRRLLTQVAQRLGGQGGDPVIQLQTAFGGGKTHTMLAVWHLAARTCALSELPGIPRLIERAGLMDIPAALTAVIDGTAHAPGQPWKEGRTTIHTLWGELAWQLGGAAGFALLQGADASGTAPGKKLLAQLLKDCAPCVVLMDELVAYIRQFPEGKVLSGGTFESNISFVHELTEAVKQVPNAVLLASLPESDPEKDKNLVQVAGERGLLALRALEDVFGRVQAIWKPVGAEESFEIVRRRLFEPIRQEQEQHQVCRAFANTYTEEGARLPSETRENRYYERLLRAYPIHPELFDRLYENWSSIDGFQRTRGVLRLLAKVISRLWQDNNQDVMILPGSLPLADTGVRNDLISLLQPGWDPVIDSDIDGERAGTTALEKSEPRFGQVSAARRVARTLFLATAPSSVAIQPGNRGIDRGRVLLGCLQPGQAAAVYTDVLARMADRLHYLNNDGDKSADSTRYWFDTRANLRREMETRKQRFDERTVVRKEIEKVAAKLFNGTRLFEGVHVFTPHADVPDDSALRLVVLPPEYAFTKENRRKSDEGVLEYLRGHGNQPRHRANRLLFIAPDNSALNRLSDATRVALAWADIVTAVQEGRLNIDQVQTRQARREAEAASKVLPRTARECFKWLLCPVLDDPSDPQTTIEAFPLNTSSGTPSGELERVCLENELIIEAWSPVHLRARLKELYWKAHQPHIPAMRFWEDSLRYLYLPRLKTRHVLADVIRTGSASKDFFGIAYGFSDGKYEGFQLGGHGVSLDDTVLLIDLKIAQEFAATAKQDPPPPTLPPEGGQFIVSPPSGPDNSDLREPPGKNRVKPSDPTLPFDVPVRSFHGSVDVDATLAKSTLNTIAEEVIALLTADPNATVRLTLEIDAAFEQGASDSVRRSVSENAVNLGFKSSEWE